jgi:glutamate-1-semialdehyde 2,1-aminomutase
MRTHLVPFNDLDAVRATLEASDDIGLLLVEPALGNMGLILPEAGYLGGLRKLTRDYGALLAFDEVISGFRASLGGAQGLWDVRPDLTMLGKVLGGGLPLAAYGGRRELMSQIAPQGAVYQAGTFSGNPLSLAASRAVLETLDWRGVGKVERRTAELVDALKDTFADAGVSAQVPVLGSLFSIFLSGVPVPNAERARASDGKRYLALARELLRAGVFLPQSPFESLFLSVAHSSQDIATVTGAVRRALPRI